MLDPSPRLLCTQISISVLRQYSEIEALKLPRTFCDTRRDSWSLDAADEMLFFKLRAVVHFGKHCRNWSAAYDRCPHGM